MGQGQYDIQIKPAAQKEINRIPPHNRVRIETAIINLADNPRPHGAKKLQGAEDNTYRIRVGQYRVIYRIYDSELVVLVVKVADRKDIYRP